LADAARQLATHIWVSALRRRVEAAGGFATILAKGDPDVGSVLIVARADGQVRILSRVNIGGAATWRTLVDATDEHDVRIRESLEKQRRFDPDLWVVELDVADPARFVDAAT
jgi:hypothetical protein